MSGNGQRRAGWAMLGVAGAVLTLAVLAWLAARAEPAAAPSSMATASPVTARTAITTATATVTGAARTATPAAARSVTPTGAALGTVAYDRLPPEARDTLRLIERGGPFPYRQDGAEFQNRERLLPLQERGYYREYTVETPGSPDRGARRIVTGRGGEIYYTDDHYDSFRRVVPP